MNILPAALPLTLAALVLIAGPVAAEPKPKTEPAPAQAPPERVSFDFVVNNQVRRAVIELNPTAAPQTVANFKKLIGEGFYNGLAVHRAIPDYLIQLGDPLTKDDSTKSTWGTGSPGHTVPAEIKLKHQRGCVAMARLPDSRNPSKASNGSQFYIALADMSQLDGKYTVFGQVVRGIEHLDYISERTTDTNDVPMERIKVTAVIGEGPTKTPAVEAIAQSAESITKGAAKGAGTLTKGAMSAASQGVRAAGAAVKDADKILPKIDLHKVDLPFIGPKKEEAAAAAAAEAAMPPAPPSAPASAPASPAPSSSQEVILQEVPEAETKEKRGLRLPSLPKFHKPGGSAMSEPVPSPDLIPTSSTAAAPPAPAPVPAPKASPAPAPLAASAPAAAPVDAAAATQPAAPAQPTPTGERQRVSVPVDPPKPKEKGFLGKAITRFW
jgi:cyclophilin family peptidyl-prolyl cis-trans isomerase